MVPAAFWVTMSPLTCTHKNGPLDEKRKVVQEHTSHLNKRRGGKNSQCCLSECIWFYLKEQAEWMGKVVAKFFYFLKITCTAPGREKKAAGDQLSAQMVFNFPSSGMSLRWRTTQPQSCRVLNSAQFSLIYTTRSIPNFQCGFSLELHTSKRHLAFFCSGAAELLHSTKQRANKARSEKVSLCVNAKLLQVCLLSQKWM